jgi:hypothetical protein
VNSGSRRIKVDCRNTRDRLAGGEIQGEAMARHLEDCADCRAFRSDLDEVKRLLGAPAVTPDRLRADTLADCLDVLDESPSFAETAVRSRFSFTPQAVAAMALLGTAILVGLSIGIADASGEIATRFAVKSVFVQLVIQNFAAALLAPALWPLLRRLVMRPVDPQPVTGV